MKVEGLYVVKDGGECRSSVHDRRVTGPMVIDHRSSNMGFREYRKNQSQLGSSFATW